jgi:hypothetical protein
MQALWREPRKCIERFLRAVQTLMFAGIGSEPNPEAAAQNGRVAAQGFAVRRIGYRLALLLCAATAIATHAQAQTPLYLIYTYSTSYS